MKLKISRLNAAELLKAAQGTLEVDLTEDMIKAIGLDQEAMTMNLMTKGEGLVGDSNIAASLAEIKAGINALVAAMSVSTKAIESAAAPLQPTGDIASLLSGFRAEIATLKSEMAKLSEATSQTLATAEATRSEKGSGAATPTTGAITPEMAAFLQQQQASVTGRKSGGLFDFDSVQ